MWNGYGNKTEQVIWITTAKTLPNFEKPRPFISSKKPELKWYPCLLDKSLGDRLGEDVLHVYWRHFPNGTGCGEDYGAFFMKTKFKLYEN